MASIDNVMRGLEVFSRALPPGHHRQIGGADHDIIYGFSMTELTGLTLDDVRILREAKWFWDTDNDCWSVFV